LSDDDDDDDDDDRHAASAQALRSTRTNRERERQKFRPPRRRPPRGFKVGDDGWIDGSFELSVEQIVECQPVDRWVAMRIIELAEAMVGKTANAAHIRALHSAWTKINRGWPAAAEWQRLLRSYTKYALRYRQLRSDPGGAAPVMTTGADIVASVRMRAPYGTVPSGLKAEMVEAILRSSTLGRGGSAGTRNKNVDRAVDALIRRLGQKVHRGPRETHSKRKRR
jgi:hypothetical protein